MTKTDDGEKKATQKWVALEIQLSLKDYATKSEVEQIRSSLWGPRTDGKDPEMTSLWRTIDSKLSKPSIWAVVVPLIVALVTWAAAKSFGAPLG